MSNVKHTPGPWEVNTNYAEDWGSNRYSFNAEVGFSTRPKNTVEEAHANAQLIAAAPELAEVLVNLIEAIEDFALDVNHKFCSVSLDDARAVLQRAGIIESKNTD